MVRASETAFPARYGRFKFWAKLIKDYIDNCGGWAKLTKDYIIILRPHPKTFVTEKRFINDLIKNNNFIIDIKQNRRMLDLYKSCDLVLADYGDSVFSSIYLEKKMLLLNLPSTSYYLQYLIAQKKLELEVRQDIESLEFNDRDNIVQIIHRLLHENDINKKNIYIKKYFGVTTDNYSCKTLAQILVNQLEM